MFTPTNQPTHDRASAGRLGKEASPLNRLKVADVKAQRYHTIRRICERLREEKSEASQQAAEVAV